MYELLSPGWPFAWRRGRPGSRDARRSPNSLTIRRVPLPSGTWTQATTESRAAATTRSWLGPGATRGLAAASQRKPSADSIVGTGVPGANAQIRLAARSSGAFNVRKLQPAEGASATASARAPCAGEGPPSAPGPPAPRQSEHNSGGDHGRPPAPGPRPCRRWPPRESVARRRRSSRHRLREGRLRTSPRDPPSGRWPPAPRWHAHPPPNPPSTRWAASPRRRKVLATVLPSIDVTTRVKSRRDLMVLSRSASPPADRATDAKCQIP